LTINLTDGRQVKSTHVCDINIPGLPTTLTGHIVHNLEVALLFGILMLCKAGCTVVFSDKTCNVYFKKKNHTPRVQGSVHGLMDPANQSRAEPSSEQRTEERKQKLVTTQVQEHHQSPKMALFNESWPYHKGVTYQILPAKIMNIPKQFVGPCIGSTPHPAVVNVTSFTHLVKAQVNAVKFAHQSLCNPKISALLKAVQKEFLKGCPNINEKLILKYLNPSPATAKGHMKQPRHGI